MTENEDAIPERLRSRCHAAAGAGAVDSADARRLPPVPGAYLLVMRLAAPLNLTLGALPRTVLPAGWYVYAGSARGPGGLRARVGRHLRRDKTIHWHVDHLSRAAAAMRCVAAPGGRECALLDVLLGAPGFTVPLPGFGSSDCRRCPSHLLGAGADP